jgi:glycosyltransferase involved in cell wall biosynthesis
MRIIWHSNSPLAPTGYGQQTALFAPMIAEHHDLAISTNYGLDGAPIVWNGIPVLPGLGGDHGNATIPGHVNAVFEEPRGGLVLTLYDTGPFDAQMFKRLNAACWTPVDHDPVPPAVVGFLRGSQAIPIAMSRFGERELKEFDPLYVPHGVDLDTYKPTPSDVREMMDVPEDAFLIAMVAANKGRPSRKCFQQAFDAFRQFREKHDDAYLYVHTTLSPEWAQGEDLLALASALDLPEDALKFPNQYSMIFSPAPRERMAEIYSAADVLLNASMGEGFGIPVLEAQAAGTPAIVTNVTAMSEVCGAGWKVSGSPYWTTQGSWMTIPHVEEIILSLEQCYGLSDEERRVLSQKAREHARAYAAPAVFEKHMLPALREIEERIGARKPELVAA